LPTESWSRSRDQKHNHNHDDANDPITQLMMGSGQHTEVDYFSARAAAWKKQGAKTKDGIASNQDA
jgi:hypothetical protein